MKDPVEFCVIIRRETDKAFLVQDGTKEIWIPKSQIELDQDGGVGDTVVVTMPEWLAIEKELI